VEFGYGLITCQRHPDDSRSDVELYRDALRRAERAERLGYHSVWVSEHHFVDDAYMPSLLPVCAAMAARTSRIRVGTALVLAPLYDPLRLAEDAATVDLLSDGRLILGLGQGWRQEEFEALDVPLRGRGERTESTVHVLRQAWGGGGVTGHGSLRLPGVSVTPKPTRETGPPVWIGAMAEASIRRAARVADGFMATEVAADSFAQQVSWARRELEARGRDPGDLTFSVHLPTFAWPGADAWERVRDGHHYVAWKYEDMEEARARTGDPRRPPRLSAIAEEELKAQIVMGTPEEVIEQLAAFDAAAGGDLHYIARLYFPGIDAALLDEAMEIFATEVVPKLASPPAET
jgi:alkanesulfonate monooxygenase SsuD/methylene tetrahydromethanopterin reductase-like flavin-dependent oxidoreductase (luciferase family)